MEGRSQGLRKGTWTAEEDSLLRKCVEKYGEGKWHQVPSRAGLNRCRKSCRLRWLNYLKPNIKRGKLSVDEVDLVFRLHKLLGNRWSLIAGRLPGRTANDVKNYWNTHLCKKQLHSSNSNILSTCKKHVQSYNCNVKPTCMKTMNADSPDEPVRKIEVIKPRPRSFYDNTQRRLLHAPRRTTSPESSNKDCNNSDSISCGDNTCDKDGYEIMNDIVNEGRETMWWESLLEESEGVAAAEEKLTAAAAAESSLMNSAAMTFDVELWNLLNA